ncbi:hypothetical protein DBR06_SOUSAS38510003, partial [Sousa chinensis]
MKLDFFIFGKLVLGDDKGPSAAEKGQEMYHCWDHTDSTKMGESTTPKKNYEIKIVTKKGIQQLLNLNIAAHGTGCDRSTKKERERAMVIVNHYSNYNYIHRDTPIWYTMFFLDLQSQTGIWGLTTLLQ